MLRLDRLEVPVDTFAAVACILGPRLHNHIRVGEVVLVQEFWLVVVVVVALLVAPVVIVLRWVPAVWRVLYLPLHAAQYQ